MNEHAPPEHRSGFNRASHRYSRGLTFHAAMAISAAMLLTLAACRTPSPSPRVATPEQAPPPPVDATYDWHALLIAPFGNVLKEIPVALHEVLLFRDETHGSAAADDAECYAIDAPAPRFMGRTPDEYLLCFKQDRLLRIQAAVRLTTAEAPEVFATACAGWLKNANPATAGGAAPMASHCEGRDGAIRFSAHLEEDPAGAELPRAEPPRAEPPPAETTLSIILDSAPAP
jgi:putative hemolysin